MEESEIYSRNGKILDTKTRAKHNVVFARGGSVWYNFGSQTFLSPENHVLSGQPGRDFILPQFYNLHNCGIIDYQCGSFLI